jgi:hypothetical protein
MSKIIDIIETYNEKVKKLPDLHLKQGGGKTRSSSGRIFENLIRGICVENGFIPKKNDYKKTEEIDGFSIDNHQVDFHIYHNNKFKKAVESKTYLDSCYLKRTVLDFMVLISSTEVPDDIECAIFTGQQSISQDSMNYYCSYFKKMTGKSLNIFVINKFKKRDGSRAIYMEQFNDDFQLDISEVNKFVEWMKK